MNFLQIFNFLKKIKLPRVVFIVTVRLYIWQAVFLPPLKNLSVTTVSYLGTFLFPKVDTHMSHKSLNRYQQTRKSRPYQPLYYRIMSLKAFESVSRSVMSTFLRPQELYIPSVHGILQAKILERVAMSFSRESSSPGDRT